MGIDKQIDTYLHQINFYELAMNTMRLKTIDPILDGILDNYEFAIKNNLAKQLDIRFSINIPDIKKAKVLESDDRDHDIRVLDHVLLRNPEELVDAFLGFIIETNEIGKMI
jgi:hypothetical protein